jgi:D-alanine transaminase
MRNDFPREPLANLNGNLVPLAEAKVPVLDRGFLFGDAVYEVLRVYAGRPWLEEEHFQRLARSLDAVRLAGVDLNRVRERMRQTIAAGGFREATVYIQITRGVAPRSHPFPASVAPLELLYVQEFADAYRQARQDGAAVIAHPDLRWRRCDIKSTNLLGNVLAMQAAKEAGCLEALLVAPDGTLTEGTHTSFFAVRNGTLLTAPNSPSILPGCTRALVLRLAGKLDVPVREQAVRRDEVGQLAELFLTGTTAEVLPVVRVDDRPVGDGIPGSVTRRLQRAYADVVRDFLA